MGGDTLKQFLPLAGKPVLVHTIERFAAALLGAQIIAALPEAQIPRWNGIAREHGIEGRHIVCVGGPTRFDSVRNAIALLEECDLVGIHDGVRPLVSKELILRSFDVAARAGTAIPVTEPTDSFRVVDAAGSLPFDRGMLRAVQTPQVFRRDLLTAAYQTPYDPRFTDDASVVEHSGVELTLCAGERENIKVTTPADLIFAEALLAAGR